MLLTTSPLTEGTSYTVTVSNVADLFGNQMPGSEVIGFSYDGPQVEDGLVGYWGFDEGTGGTADDYSGNDNDGSISGAVWTLDSREGNALYFDGDDMVDLGLSTFGIGQTNSFSISCWFKYEGTEGGYLVRRGDYVHPYMIECTPTGRINTNVRTTGTNALTGSTGITPGEWYHCVMTYEDGARVTYINGVLDAGNVVTGAPYLNPGANTRVGEAFTGVIDELKIYNRALSESEVQDLFNQ